MRRITLGLALLLIAALGQAALGEPRVRIDARLDPPFLIEKLEVEGLEAVPRLTFNLSAYARAVEYAVAAAGGVTARGVLNGSLVTFDFGRPTAGASVWIVLRALNASGFVATLTAPLPLAPLEAGAANASFTVWGIPSDPLDVKSGINLSRGYSPDRLNYLRGNTTARPGSLEVVEVQLSASGLTPAVERLVRVVVVEPGSLTILDNYTLLGLAGQGASDVTFTYAAGLDLKSVKGLVAPYPPTLYSATRTCNSTVVRVSLIAPPQSAGDRAYVQLELSMPLRREGGAVEIPAFIGVGRYVPDARVLVKVRGTATFRGLNPVREWQEGDYRVYELGVFKLLGEGLEPRVYAEVALAPRAPTGYVAVSALLAAAAATAYLLHTRTRKESAAPAPAAAVVRGEFSAALRERVSNIEALVDAWDRYSAGRLSRQAYRQLVSKLKRREEELKKRCREEASAEAAAQTLEKADKLVSEILSRLSKLEEAKLSMERGTLQRKEGKKLLNELRSSVAELLDELETLIEQS